VALGSDRSPGSDDPLAKATTGPGTDADAVLRLCHQSVDRQWDPYLDIDWDSRPLRSHDERTTSALGRWDPLATTDWYRDQPAATQVEVGLARLATMWAVAISFEWGLQYGLLGMAAQLPPGSPVWRYVHHEIVEEARHTLMFQEFIQQTGLPVSAQHMTHWGRLADDMAEFGRSSPELLLLCAVSGEFPGDHVQRLLVADPTIHPVIRTVSRIHSTEEARHLSFARVYLQRSVASLGDRERRRLEHHAPRLILQFADRVLTPPDELRHLGGIPDEVFDQAYRGSEHAALKAAGMTRSLRLAETLGIVNERYGKHWAAVATGGLS
jgi:hypothetical protein